MKKIILFSLILGLLFPYVAQAGSYQVCTVDKTTGKCTDAPRTATYEGLVPCGKAVNISGVGVKVIPCQFCHFFVLFKALLDFVLGLIIIIAVLMIVVGGFLMITSSGNPGLIGKGKTILTNTIIGLVIIFVAWIVVNIIIVTITSGNISIGGIGKIFGNPWYQIECQIDLSKLNQSNHQNQQ